MITKSDEALAMWEELCGEFDSFWECAMEDLDGVTIEGGERAYNVFEQLSFSKTWTYFWTGDVYVLFPCTERQLIKGLRDQKRKQKVYDAEAEEEEQDSGLKQEREIEALRQKTMEAAIVNKFQVAPLRTTVVYGKEIK
jgi:hypothetical protein